MLKNIVRFTVASMSVVMMYAGCQSAHAERTESGDSTKVFFSLKGEKLTAVQAYKQDGKFLQCQVVEVVTNEKTGRQSIKK